MISLRRVAWSQDQCAVSLAASRSPDSTFACPSLRPRRRRRGDRLDVDLLGVRAIEPAASTSPRRATRHPRRPAPELVIVQIDVGFGHRFVRVFHRLELRADLFAHLFAEVCAPSWIAAVDQDPREVAHVPAGFQLRARLPARPDDGERACVFAGEKAGCDGRGRAGADLPSASASKIASISPPASNSETRSARRGLWARRCTSCGPCGRHMPRRVPGSPTTR